MTNLAKKPTVVYPEYKKEKLIYGCFGECNPKDIAENVNRMKRAQVKAGISFGGKISFSALLGMISAQHILEWQNVRSSTLPAFFLVLLWASCAGSIFCMTGLLRNIICAILRK